MEIVPLNLKPMAYERRRLIEWGLDRGLKIVPLFEEITLDCVEHGIFYLPKGQPGPKVCPDCKKERIRDRRKRVYLKKKSLPRGS